MAARWLDQRYVLLVMQTVMDEALRLYRSVPSSTAFYRAAVADEVILGLRIARVLIDDGVRGHANSILRLDCDSESINLLSFGTTIQSSTARAVLDKVDDDRLRGTDDDDGDEPSMNPEIPDKVTNAFHIARKFIKSRYDWTLTQEPTLYTDQITFEPSKSVARVYCDADLFCTLQKK